MRAYENHAPAVDILIAEDKAPERQALRFFLEQQGYRCAEAGDGREAVELAKIHRPRCVLLDLRMPGLDGFAVARQLRADPLTRETAIHCLTGLTGDSVRQQARAAGFERFLTKPVEPDALLEAISLEPRETAEWLHGLTKGEAEALLDWLQAHGEKGEVAHDEQQRFAVRCPGFRRWRDDGGEIVVSSL